MNEQELDEIRRRMQESLIDAKREELRKEYGMQMDNLDSSLLSPEAKNEWLDYVLEFERQFENAEMITVRERIGNPTIRPVEEISQSELEETADGLLELLYENAISVDFLGEWDDLSAYRYLTEELLESEIDDVHIENMFTCFTATTPEYDVEMWVQDFVWDLFRQEREYFLPGLEKQPLFDVTGEPVSHAWFVAKIETVWSHLPPIKGVNFKPIVAQVVEDEGTVTAVITWTEDEKQKQVESHFRLQPSPYGGWDVVQTSLLDDLLTLLGSSRAR
ncbi:MAG: hypothetical protein WAM60_01220 [Candidatus Promineifilaceae bacterium]